MLMEFFVRVSCVHVYVSCICNSFMYLSYYFHKSFYILCNYVQLMQTICDIVKFVSRIHVHNMVKLIVITLLINIIALFVNKISLHV